MSDNVWIANDVVSVGPWRALEYREVNVRLLENMVSDVQAALEQEAENHPDDCEWWGDWQACSCGAFNKQE
jgi:hypothetical protein